CWRLYGAGGGRRGRRFIHESRRRSGVWSGRRLIYGLRPIGRICLSLAARPHRLASISLCARADDRAEDRPDAPPAAALPAHRPAVVLPRRTGTERDRHQG
uniref:Uncharacterized protein n=1 Tax=Plectus sambesii TaxID=2011161 RepID=A0A914XGK9_9BILA